MVIELSDDKQDGDESGITAAEDRDELGIGINQVGVRMGGLIAGTDGSHPPYPLKCKKLEA